MIAFRLTGISLVAVILAGCGGGGSSSTENAPTLSLNQAWKSYLQQSGSTSYKISGTVNSVAYSGTGEYIKNFSNNTSLLVINTANPFAGPGPSITWGNLSRSLFQFSSNISASGSSAVVYAIENWYYDNAGNLRVIDNNEDLEQTIVTNFTPFPAQVTSGSSGAFFNGTVYSRLGYTCGTVTGTYAVNSRTADSLTFKITISSNTTERAIGQCTTEIASTEYTYALSSSGLFLRGVTFTSNAVNGSLNFTF